jgi:hypothetical protein
MTTQEKLFELLRNTDIPLQKGKGRLANVQRMVLGRVKMWFGKGYADSRHNKKFPELLALLKQFVEEHDPEYEFDAVTVNKDHQILKHVDRNNKDESYIFGFGDYTGGELVFESGPYAGTHDIKEKWLKFVGDKPHWVEPFEGERYSIVYYHWK